jgi:hypothetical protein
LPRAARRRASRRRSRCEVTKESADDTATIIPIAGRIARQQAAEGRGTARSRGHGARCEREAHADGSVKPEA